MHMESMLDVRKLLKKYNIFIYTRDPVGDAILMEMELEELFKAGLISNDDYLKARMILEKEKKMRSKADSS